MSWHEALKVQHSSNSIIEFVSHANILHIKSVIFVIIASPARTWYAGR